MKDLYLSIGDSSHVAYTIQVDFNKLLINGDRLGDVHTKCYLGVFKSTEIQKDTWHMGNAIMDDYYAVFDLTPADERKQDYIQFGIGKKAANHQFEKENGPMQNIVYDSNGYETVPETEPLEDDDMKDHHKESMRKDLDSGFGTMMFMIIVSVFATVVCLCHFRDKKKEEDIQNDRLYEQRRSTLDSRRSS